jgi:alpha-L-arabinofuranosidase
VQQGSWGRYRGLPINLEAVRTLQAMGVRLLRYGGTFTQTQTSGWVTLPNGTQQRQGWELFRGKAWERKPFTATSRGGVHLTKLSRWSRGFGVVEVLQLCEEMSAESSSKNGRGFVCVLAFPSGETPMQMASFIEYAFGDASTSFGRQRALDGHPAPYALEGIGAGFIHNPPHVTHPSSPSSLAQVPSSGSRWATSSAWSHLAATSLTLPIPPPDRLLHR